MAMLTEAFKAASGGGTIQGFDGPREAVLHQLALGDNKNIAPNMYTEIVELQQLEKSKEKKNKEDQILFDEARKAADRIRQLEKEIENLLKDLSADINNFTRTVDDINERLFDFIVKKTEEKKEHTENYEKIEELRRQYALNGRFSDNEREDAIRLIGTYGGEATGNGDARINEKLGIAQPAAQQKISEVQGSMIRPRARSR